MEGVVPGLLPQAPTAPSKPWPSPPLSRISRSPPPDSRPPSACHALAAW